MPTEMRLVGRAGDAVAPTEDVDVQPPDPESELGGRILLVTESPYGTNPDPETWGGVLRFELGEEGALLPPATGIAAQHLHDPWGLAWRDESQELFVGNRHGNFPGQADSAGIQRFLYDADANAFVTNGTITGDDLREVHQIELDPETGELFAANGASGIARFTFDDSGTATSNGALETGMTRGVTMSPGGRKLWVTSATASVRQFDVGTWNELAPVATEDGAMLQNLTVHDGLLYAPGYASDAIYRFRIGTDEDLVLLDAIEATSPVCVAFSRDGERMYASGDGVIERFTRDSANDSWELVEAVPSERSFGSMVVLDVIVTPTER
jgi:hypothetical protein